MLQVQKTHDHRKVLELTNAIQIINLEVTIWSGSKKILPHELGINLPSDRIATTGKKNLIRREVIEEFERVRSKAHYYLSSIGIKLLGGIVVPAERMQEVTQVMQEYQRKFQEKILSFQNEFEKNINDILEEAEQEGWLNLIEEDCKALTSEKVAGKFSFNWYALKIDPNSIENESSTVSGILSIPEVVLEKVAKLAQDALKSYVDKDSINRRSLQSLETMKERLSGLAVFNPNAGAIASVISEVVSMMPDKGEIAGTDFVLQKRLVETIASPSSANRLAEERLKGERGFIFDGFEQSLAADDEADIGNIADTEPEAPDAFVMAQSQRRELRDGPKPEVYPLMNPAAAHPTTEEDIAETFRDLSDDELDALFNLDEAA